MWDKDREDVFLDRDKVSRRLRRELKKQKDKKRRKWDGEDGDIEEDWGNSPKS